MYIPSHFFYSFHLVDVCIKKELIYYMIAAGEIGLEINSFWRKRQVIFHLLKLRV